MLNSPKVSLQNYLIKIFQLVLHFIIITSIGLKYDHPMFIICWKVINEKDASVIRLSGERPINDDDSIKGIFDVAFG